MRLQQKVLYLRCNVKSMYYLAIYILCAFCGAILVIVIITIVFGGKFAKSITVELSHVRQEAHNFNTHLTKLIERQANTTETVDSIKSDIKDLSTTQNDIKVILTSKLDTTEFMLFKESTEKRLKDIEKTNDQQHTVLQQVEQHLVYQNHFSEKSTIYNPITLKK